MMLVTLTVLPATAAMDTSLIPSGQQFKSILSFDEAIFNGVTNETQLKDAKNGELGLTGMDPHNYKVEIKAGGESGKAYHWYSPTGTSNTSYGGVTFNLNALEVDGDFSDATNLVFWVDLSAMNADNKAQVGISLKFNGADDKSYEYQIASGVSIVENGAWKACTPGYVGWSRIELPTAYKGWVSIGLKEANWAISDVTKMDDASATKDKYPFDLENVVGLGVGVSLTSPANDKIAVIDSIGLLTGEATGGQTIPTGGNNGTTAGPNTTTQKNADTGDVAIPAAAALVALLCGGVVIVTKKRG